MLPKNIRASFATVVLVLLAADCAAPLPPDKPRPERERPKAGACANRLTRQVLEESLTLGTQFLLNNQRPAGNFTYLYDWKAKMYAPGDNQIRQAGALWGLVLIHQARSDSTLETAIGRALDFFLGNSRTAADGARYVVYPKDPHGGTGTVALMALALTDYLRVSEKHLPADKLQTYREALDGYLKFLLGAQTVDGLWHASFQHADGAPYGAPSPYADGEALLALVKAARYGGRDDLRERALAAADAGYRLNIVQALQKDPDSTVTKGYYQWSSMAYYELSTSGWEGTQEYGDHVMELADWMIDVHRTLTRLRNTGYAYEGIIHAYQVAIERGLGERAQKYSCVIDQGLEKLTSWQVGSPLAGPYFEAAAAEDRLALGGVQNHEAEPGLRIDVTQHQMHAVVLALRYVYIE